MNAATFASAIACANVYPEKSALSNVTPIASITIELPSESGPTGPVASVGLTIT